MKRWLELFQWFVELVARLTTARWRRLSQSERDKIIFSWVLVSIIAIIILVVGGSVIAEYHRSEL